MERKLLIGGGGGMGNRLNGMIDGIFFNEQCYNGKLFYLWKADDYACDCDFKYLFKPIDGLEIISDKNYEVSGNDWDPIIRGEGDLNSIIFDPKGCDQFKEHDKVALSQSNIINDLKLKDVVRILKRLEPVDSIQEEVNNFCNKNNIDKNTYGVHIRRADCPELGHKSDEPYIEKIKELIFRNGPDSKFLVCSDDEETELKFKSLFPNNVIYREKQAYTQKKFPDQGWRDIDGIDSATGKMAHWKYNVRISKQAVIDGLIDMQLLSRTKFDMREFGISYGGTFCRMAYYYSLIPYYDEISSSKNHWEYL